MAPALGHPVGQPQRSQMLDFFRQVESPCVVAMEACGSAHYWGRELIKLGHEVRHYIHAPLRASILCIPFRSRLLRLGKIQHPRNTQLRLTANFRIDMNFVFAGF